MQVNSSIIKKWTLYCALGELTGIAIAGCIAFFVNSSVGEPQSILQKFLVLFSMLIAGAIEGTLLGWFQWKVLRQLLPVQKLEWVGITIAVAVLGWLFGMMPSLFFISPDATSNTNAGIELSNAPLLFAALCISAGLILGGVFGAFQYIVLKRYVSNAGWWILANALGWGAGLGWIYVGASLPDEHSGLLLNIASGAAGGILAGLSVGFVTGLFLRKLRIR